MTTYSAITSAEIDADSPITDALLGKFSDNPIAMFEGAAGAPRLLGEAVATAANGGLPVLTVTASDAYLLDEGVTPSPQNQSHNNTSHQLGYRFTVRSFTGSIRFRATHTSTNAAWTSWLELRKNGSVVIAFSTTTTAARSVDVSVVPGDVVEWYHRITSASFTTILGDVSSWASNGYQAQTTWKKAV